MKLKILISILILTLVVITSHAQSSDTDINSIEMQAKALVEEQLEAYNNRDIEAFLKPYSDDIKIYSYPDEFNYEGKENMRKGYTQFFERATNLHCELVSRMVIGNKVIDQERVTGFSQNKEDVLHAVAIYTIENGKISEVRFVRR